MTTACFKKPNILKSRLDISRYRKKTFNSTYVSTFQARKLACKRTIACKSVCEDAFVTNMLSFTTFSHHRAPGANTSRPRVVKCLGVADFSSDTVLCEQDGCMEGWPLGAQVCEAEGRVTFKAWVPHATQVSLEIRIESEVQRVALFQEGDFWGGALTGAVQAGTMYRLLVESNWNDCYAAEGGELVRRDPFARQADFDSEWCTIAPPAEAFKWKVDDITPESAFVAWSKLNMYELQIGSFSPQGTFAGALDYLEHIRHLGFNAIQVMPITEFGGTWGYNPRQLMSIHSPWGSPDDVRRFVDRCHELEMSVLVDIVLNHGAARGNTLWMWDGYGPNNNGGIYFETGKNTPWGRQFAFDKPQVEHYLVEAARMWLREYNVDGLRMDSVHNMPWDLLQRMNKSLSLDFPGKILIAEITPETSKAITSARFHSQWRHSPHFDVLKLHSGKADQWVDITRSVVDIPKGYQAGFNGVVSILGSHDQIGCRKNGGKDGEGHLHRHFVDRVGGRNSWHARAQTRMWWAVNGTSRCLPMMFMGDEWLQDKWWHCDANDKTKWMQWPAQVPLDGTIFKQEFDASALGSSTQQSIEMARCVRAVNLLREHSDALTSENVTFPHRDYTQNILGCLRWEPDSEAMLVVVNTSEYQCAENEYKVNLGDLPFEAHSAQLVFNSQAKEFGGWDGSATDNNVSVEKNCIHIKVPKWSVMVYKLID